MTKTNEKTIASFKALQNLTVEALTSAKTMRSKVQKLLVGCVSHWKLTGSNDGLKQLINGFVKDGALNGVNTPAITAWCEKHLHMFVGEDKDGKPALFFKSGIVAKDLNTKVAAEENWWELRKQSPFKFDQLASLRKLAKASAEAAIKAEKAREAGREVKSCEVDDAITAKLAELVKLAEARDGKRIADAI